MCPGSRFRAASATNRGGLCEASAAMGLQCGGAGAPIDARREGSPMPASPCHEKGVFSGPLPSRPGGLRRAGRRCDVSVAFERENPQLSLRAGKETSKFDADRGCSPRRAELNSHSCDLKA